MALGAYTLFLPLATTAFGDTEGYFSLAIIAFVAFGSIRKRVVSKRVVSADVQRISPCIATLAEERYDFLYSWAPKPRMRAHSPKPPFYKTALLQNILKQGALPCRFLL